MPKPAGKTVLFLGTGDHDRGRVAEILFNALAAKMGLGWSARSRGLCPKQPTKKEGPLAVASAKWLRDRGSRDAALDRAPAAVIDADLAAADTIVAMNRAENETMIRDRFPGLADGVRYWEIPPGPTAYLAVEREVSNFVARLLGGNASDESAEPSPEAARTKAKGETVRVGRETKGRKGKGVTIVTDLPLEDEALRDLAAALKAKCGTGGTAKDGRIEIQGDQRDRIAAELEMLGYRVKRAGG